MADMKLVLGRWATPLSQLGERGDFAKVIKTMNTMYADKDLTILPEKHEVFRAFRLLEPEDVRVVILGMDPYPTVRESTGYAFSNPEGTVRMSKSLQKIHETIEDTFHDGLLLDFDPTLSHWAKQGVLSLNSALTVEAGKSGSHTHIWQGFTEMLIDSLSKNLEGIHFCFWGKQAQRYAYLVDPFKHNVYSCYHPAYAVRQREKWECDHFEKINKALKPPIKW